MKFNVYFRLLLASVLILPSCNIVGQERVRGSGNVTKEERNVGAFKAVDLRGDIDVYLTQGPAKAAVIEAEDNIIPLIELVKEGDELVVRLKRHVSVNTQKDMKVYLTTPDIEKVNLSGSGDIDIQGKFNSNNGVRVNVSGSGDVEGAFNAPSVKASIAGSGNIELSGETKDAEVSIAGSGDFKGKELLSENVSVNITGSGNANVHASVKLDAKIVGSGDVHYKGSPQISSRVIGSGSVSKD
jgi:hypothetical protein